MLGSRSDADDVVQEAYLRWTRSSRASVKSPRAYLHSIVSHHFASMSAKPSINEQTYVGPWLPEPIVEPSTSATPDRVERAESVSMALLLILESLSPTERAAYLLRQVFDYPYPEIAEILDKSEPTCRQLVSRAEAHVMEKRPRFEADPAKVERLTDAFVQACASGDLDGLVQILAADAVMYSDGGGKAKAALALSGVPITLPDSLSASFRKSPGHEIHRVLVNKPSPVFW